MTRVMAWATAVVLAAGLLAGCQTGGDPGAPSPDPAADLAATLSALTLDQVAAMDVSSQPELFDATHITDPAELARVVRYLSGLKVGPAHEAQALSGAAIVIGITYKDGRTARLVIVGNTYIQADGGPAHDVTTDQAQAFMAVIGKILLDRYAKDFTGKIIVGVVTAVTSSPTGATTAATVNTTTDGAVAVDVSTARHITDVSGTTGWMILHAGDIVEIGLGPGNTADLVFITDASQSDCPDPTCEVTPTPTR